jgi:hypothetical protein
MHEGRAPTPAALALLPSLMFSSFLLHFIDSCFNRKFLCRLLANTGSSREQVQSKATNLRLNLTSFSAEGLKFDWAWREDCHGKSGEY